MYTPYNYLNNNGATFSTLSRQVSGPFWPLWLLSLSQQSLLKSYKPGYFLEVLRGQQIKLIHTVQML